MHAEKRPNAGLLCTFLVALACTDVITNASAQTLQPTANAEAFDPSSLPVSSVPLGDFPYIQLPKGYISGGTPEVSDFDQIPFWTGDRLEPVEGKVWSVHVAAAPGKAFSDVELERNIASVVQSLGGQAIFNGQIPDEPAQQVKAWPHGFALKYNSGLGDIWNNPAHVYVVHRAGRDIWIHLCSYAFGAGLIIAERTPLEITAGVLSESELKAQLDGNGNVLLPVNFATDSASILPGSKPQIERVVELLKHDTALKLSIHGYTDGTGDSAHNTLLSNSRASAVLNELIARGIDASRLSSAGFGDSNPVAGNETEAGRSQNRRVELVKQR